VYEQEYIRVYIIQNLCALFQGFYGALAGRTIKVSTLHWSYDSYVKHGVISVHVLPWSRSAHVRFRVTVLLIGITRY
jgi:hypothetical protein